MGGARYACISLSRPHNKIPPGSKTGQLPRQRLASYGSGGWKVRFLPWAHRWLPRCAHMTSLVSMETERESSLVSLCVRTLILLDQDPTLVAAFNLGVGLSRMDGGVQTFHPHT